MKPMITRFAAGFDARTPWIGAGRTLIALGQLSILLFAPSTALMVPVVGRADAPYCDGIKSISLYCLGNMDPEIWRWIFVGVLLIIASGFAPRWTVVPHAWICFSLNQSIALPDGGESVAQVLTLLLIPVCLFDNRKWHWAWPAEPPSPVSRGVTLSASLMIRIQMAAIYINSGVAKLGTDAWLDGSAEYYISRDKNFGASGIVEPVIVWVTSYPWGTAAFTWGTILLECALAILLLGNFRMRLLALVLGTVLHLAIIATIGLWSFSLIMIGGLALAASTNAVATRGIVTWWRSRRSAATMVEAA